MCAWTISLFRGEDTRLLGPPNRPTCGQLSNTPYVTGQRLLVGVLVVRLSFIARSHSRFGCERLLLIHAVPYHAYKSTSQYGALRPVQKKSQGKKRPRPNFLRCSTWHHDHLNNLAWSPSPPRQDETAFHHCGPNKETIFFLKCRA